MRRLKRTQSVWLWNPSDPYLYRPVTRTLLSVSVWRIQVTYRSPVSVPLASGDQLLSLAERTRNHELVRYGAHPLVHANGSLR